MAVASSTATGREIYALTLWKYLLHSIQADGQQTKVISP